MDPVTVAFYESEAERFANLYAIADLKSIQGVLRRWLPESGRVLEIGCGNGQNARFMAETLGLDVMATDASEAMLRTASAENGHSGVQYQPASFPLPPGHSFLNNKYDAVVSIAVLMHVPQAEIFDFACQVRSLLSGGGVFVCSFCGGREPTEQDPRLYVHREAGEVQLLFERLGFQLMDREDTADGLGRSLVWTTLVLSYQSGGDLVRPVDQIESIINRDKKTATYKLALIRALCDISQHAWHHARWHPRDRVSVPLGLIVEYWIFYYWPIVESRLDLPEMRLSKRTAGLAFRPLLERLISVFQPGGLNAFFAIYQSAKLSDEQAVILGNLATAMAKTIINGPVTYAGGSLEGLDPIFIYEGRPRLSRCDGPREMIDAFGFVFFPSGIWRELGLVGHWIGEAILLRWAELSQTFSREQVRMAEILGLLMTRPQAARATAEAKAIYAREASLRCVWSGRSLQKDRFDVDHVIPFAIWHNNDLWNLLPADPRVNNSKRDRIVTRETLHTCREAIVDYWRLLRREAAVRFDNELGRSLLGCPLPGQNWEKPAFAALGEAVESVARQRGVMRWEI